MVEEVSLYRVCAVNAKFSRRYPSSGLFSQPLTFRIDELPGCFGGVGGVEALDCPNKDGGDDGKAAAVEEEANAEGVGVHVLVLSLCG